MFPTKWCSPRVSQTVIVADSDSMADMRSGFETRRGENLFLQKYCMHCRSFHPVMLVMRRVASTERIQREMRLLPVALATPMPSGVVCHWVCYGDGEFEIVNE